MSYSEKHSTQKKLLGAAHCGPEELKGSSLVPLSIGSQDGWFQASVIFQPGHNPHDATLIFRQKPYNSSTTQNVQFWHLPDRCNSRHQ